MTLHLDPRRTALVLVDLQAGTLDMPLEPYGARQVLDNSIALARKGVPAGATLVLVRVDFAADLADRLNQPVDMAMRSGPLPPGWADFPPEIAALEAQATITKRQWGAFHGTELDLQLRRRGITTIVLTGIATNFGVESTAREGWQHGYATVIAEDACSTIGADMHRFAMEKVLPRIARIRKTEDILAAF